MRSNVLRGRESPSKGESKCLKTAPVATSVAKGGFRVSSNIVAERACTRWRPNVICRCITHVIVDLLSIPFAR
jgi:hypothetical protein